MRALVAFLGPRLFRALGALWLVSKVLQAVAWVIEKVVMALVGIINAAIWAINKIPGVDIDYVDVDALTGKKKAAADAKDVKGKDNTIVQDFRGSTFNIENNFPEGVDAGRVAVAFGDEMAALGERRLDSGLRPLYSYR